MPTYMLHYLAGTTNENSLVLESSQGTSWKGGSDQGKTRRGGGSGCLTCAKTSAGSLAPNGLPCTAGVGMEEIVMPGSNWGQWH